jgi:hypothetical protein
MLRNFDPLVDRDCVMLDGKCNCPRLPGHAFPECEKYGQKGETVHAVNCQCEFCKAKLTK